MPDEADQANQSTRQRVSERVRRRRSRSCEDSPLFGERRKDVVKREEFESLPGCAESRGAHEESNPFHVSPHAVIPLDAVTL